MSLPYPQDSQLKMLTPVLDEHSEWFGNVIIEIFYPEKGQSLEILAIPASFGVWAREVESANTVEKTVLDDIRAMHSELSQMAAYLIKEGSVSKVKPEIAQFDSFVTLYEEFVAHIRRIERDMAVSESGIDLLTGLRNNHVMKQDIERELERRSRRGRPFCLALARIDHYEELKAKLPQDQYEAINIAVANIIKQCARSFDDAYRLHNGEFLLSLKMTELSGGSAALGRLRRLLEENAPLYTLNGKESRLTMSSCVAEPQPGDEVEKLIENMRVDLNRYGGDAETSLEYFELSPLQRFVSDLADDNGGKPH